MRTWLNMLAGGVLALAALAATAQPAAAPFGEPVAHGKSTRLAVLLHAFQADGERMQSAGRVLLGTEGWADTDTLAPNLPFGMFSITPPADVIAGLLATIDAAWARRAARGQPYESVVIIGHSLGSLYARKLYAAACGELADAPFEPELKMRLAAIGATPLDEVRPWADKVERIVLLAGLNSGWTISHHMALWRGLSMSAGVWLGRVLEAATGRQFIVMAAHRGAPFITQLRLQWLAMRVASRQPGAGGRGSARVVQLLGTNDDLVPPSDNIDPVTGSDFTYLEVPLSGHPDVIEMDDSVAGAGRARILRCALTEPNRCPQALRRIGNAPGDAERIDPKVTDVVFVVHGIRDEGYWTEKIAQRVLARARAQGDEEHVAVETSSYGYFPMLSFLRPGARQEKVEWLMDRYTAAKARYPNALRFSFVGHSNGTYLLSKALSDYPAVRFHNVVFAGSVVRRDYGWSRYPPERVGPVFNFVADADWVVAFFPNALQQMRVQDLGSAGYDGFADTSRATWLPAPERYVAGGHSAALDEVWWDSIAGLVLTGKFQAPAEAVLSAEHPGWIRYPAEAAPLIWLVIAVLLLFVLYRLLKMPVREWKKTVAVIAYLAFVWTIVTQF